MAAAHGSTATVSRTPMVAAPRARASAVARGVFLAMASVGSVVLLLVAPELVVLSHPSSVALVLAMAIGLLVILHLERGTLERELRAARVRSVDARDQERLRIQRDLHDSAQQRLVSIRIRLGLLSESTGRSADRATIEHLGQELDEALRDIGTVTHDGYPELLMGNGVVTSLRAAVSGSALPVTIETAGFGRYPHTVERNVYFCCMEALQNVSKHAGPGAVARIRLVGSRDRIVFEIEDTGVGFNPARVKRGDGLLNLADRLASLDGRLIVDSRPGMGTRIHGEVPVA
jgi:signal transduction histidine kinase